MNPDGVAPLGATVSLWEKAGSEMRTAESSREDCVRTTAARRRRLEESEGETVALVGEEAFRVGRSYLAGAMLAFEERRTDVDRILAVRTGTQGRTGTEGGAG